MPHNKDIDLSLLTKAEILEIVHAQGLWNDAKRRKSKADIIQDIESLPDACRMQILMAASPKVEAKIKATTAAKKRASEATRAWRAEKKQKMLPSEEEGSVFLQLPTRQQVDQCRSAFLAATSNDALKTEVCVSCARRLGTGSGESIKLDELPNRHQLVPAVPHFAHRLTNGMLLVAEHLSEANGVTEGWFCKDCTRALEANRLPALSLANRMWIGPIPIELSELTVPERSLIAKYHPRCFVYKLYPRNLWGSNQDRSTLQTALVGNVTTYALNLPQVVDMVAGRLLPRPLAILSSTIAVTMIWPGNIPPNWLKKTFRVRRAAILAAILCLKYTTRHPAYQDLDVSDELLMQIPEDDVPMDILAAIRHEPDVSTAQRESESYVHNEEEASLPVPSEEATAQASPSTHQSTRETDSSHADTAPDVIPLQHLGTVETDLASVSTEELMAHSLANIGCTSNREGAYAVRHGRTPVNEFGRFDNSSSQGEPSRQTGTQPIDNLSVNTFFWLYPYGEGGIESQRPRAVPMAEHVRCNIQEHSGRFATDPTWGYVMFSMLQKRQALLGARLQVRRRDFDRAAALFSTLSIKDLSEAAAEEAQGQRPSNPKIGVLRRIINSAGGKVMGSDTSRAAYRSEISSTALSLNPPSLWLTINPSDIHDPVVQVFAGEKIDMDNFISTAGPNSQKRAFNVANNPYAAAKFFNFMITTILETLFGIKVDDKKVVSNMGVLGYVSGYYGVVEAQGRGSLHMHMLLWLKDAPSADDMQRLLETEEFRQKLVRYVDANIRAHLDPLTDETLKSRPREPELAWSRPPDPESPQYDELLKDLEERLACSQQRHVCKRTTCLTIFDSETQTWWCKRKAPFPLNDITIVTVRGEVQPKRTHPFLNAWNPDILIYIRCNNDIKFLSNGGEARAIRWYITAYQTKKQSRGHNHSALLAKHLAYHFASSDYLDDVHNRNRLLVFRCLHILNRQMEQSGQQVFSYLMGYGDRFRSHTYVPLFLSALIGKIHQTFPEMAILKNQALFSEDNPQNLIDETRPTKDQSEEIGGLDVTSSGQLIYRSQITDYLLRGPELESWNFWTFVADTREIAITAKDNEPDIPTPETDEPTMGRPRNMRSRYLADHPKADTHLRSIRTPGHSVLPNIVGPFIPRNDQPESYDTYCATILALLKPWRDLRTLRVQGQSWKQAFESFISTATKRQLDFISAAQYHYQCKDAAARQRETPQKGSSSQATYMDEDDDDTEAVNVDDDELSSANLYGPITEAMLDAYKMSFMRKADLDHSQEALAIGRLVGILPDGDNRQWEISKPTPVAATEQQDGQFRSWKAALAKNALLYREKAGHANVGQPIDVGEVVSQADALTDWQTRRSELGTVQHVHNDGETSKSIDVTHLKEYQQRAFAIVAKHLDDTLYSRAPNQLLMQIQGEGGTGKSTVIQSITELFEHKKQSAMLQKAAYTGIAASVIDGSTLHTLCHMSVHGGEGLSETALRALRKTWGNVSYLIIDEISMISREFLSRLSGILGAAKSENDRSSGSKAFGGVNVIITGDFHQFPPVARGLSAALYMTNEEGDKQAASAGRRLYEAFRTVVILREQCRTRDEVWLDVLHNIRTGTCTQKHLDIIRSLILAPLINKGGNMIDAAEDDWRDAILVTPRNACRIAWNAAANRRHCARNGVCLLSFPAEDLVGNRALTMQERWDALQSKRGQKERYTCNGLPDVVELAIGMEVMVTVNVETELDVANGSRGRVVDIILDRREDPIPAGSPTTEIKLRFPPECVLVELYRTKAVQLPGLAQGVIPIFPMERGFEIPQKRGNNLRAKRRQVPITSAYAFTDYRSQGQTLCRVIVDIGRTPPPQKLTAFNIYVALSRSSGRDTIRLLRDFDEDTLKQPPSAKLLAEDVRLADLNERTKKRWVEKGEIYDDPEPEELKSS